MKNYWLKPKYHNGLPIVEYGFLETNHWHVGVKNGQELFYGAGWPEDDKNGRLRKIKAWLPIETPAIATFLGWGKVNVCHTQCELRGETREDFYVTLDKDTHKFVFETMGDFNEYRREHYYRGGDCELLIEETPFKRPACRIQDRIVYGAVQWGWQPQEEMKGAY